MGDICFRLPAAVDLPKIKIKYTSEDKEAIVEPTSPTTPSPGHFSPANGHELVIRNMSANADQV